MPVMRRKYKPSSFSHSRIEMPMGIRDPVGFSSIRRWVLTEFYIRESVSGINIISNGFVGPSLVFLNPDPLPVHPD
jgi:hypothetical protein